MNAIKDLVQQWNELNKSIEEYKEDLSATDILMIRIKMLEISVELTRLQFEEQEMRRRRS